MDKPSLRKAAVTRVRSLAPARRALEEEAVTAAIQASPEWQAAGTILLYRSTEWELSTVGLANAAWRMGRRTLFPRQDGDGVTLTLHHATGWSSFAAGPNGIPEPSGPAVDPFEVELALVPGVAWAPDGRRLGRGGGHYDRLLPQLRCVTWGLGFDAQVVAELPADTHDRRVDAVWSCQTRGLLPEH